MMMKRLSVAAGIIVGAASLSACQTTQQSSDDYTQVFRRADGQKMGGNPKLLAEYEKAGTICDGRVAAAASNMQPIEAHGIIGALQISQIQAQNRETLMKVQAGCMAEQGYLVVPKSQLPKG
ncbi:hypothetical protein [Segnochrobactrum spirostomi]|uniref:Lipoprotein n=1 Tax=Segnochrobactrum spirostomi TaxID=2608987 RepID=A0A6A7Y5R3_9HYPH|nr:hypothetical protein [Segnochrobactrum spirostomi]MQT13687.1 hypothetical protein [Segnochrobactrum spirostomi]